MCIIHFRSAREKFRSVFKKPGAGGFLSEPAGLSGMRKISTRALLGSP
jgi:hypothetical protein